jgi:hypothetical protein
VRPELVLGDADVAELPSPAVRFLFLALLDPGEGRDLPERLCGRTVLMMSPRTLMRTPVFGQ